MKRNVLFVLVLMAYIYASAQSVVSFTKGQPATIILPIAPDAEKGKYYRLDRWENKQLVFEEERHPQARTPYIIVPSEDFDIELSTLDVTGLRFDSLKIEHISPYDSDDMAQIFFVGTYATRRIDFFDDGQHYYILDTTPDITFEPKNILLIVGAMRAYFSIAIPLCYDLEKRRYWEKLEYVLHNQEYTIEGSVTFTKDQMATIILPTEPDASKGKYYRLDRFEKRQIVFEEELQPRARVPYIIVPSEDFSIDPGTLDLEGCRPDTASITGISFIGTYVSEVLPSLGGDGGGSLYYDIIDMTPDCGFTSSGETGTFLIGALRAYLEVDWDKLTWDDPIDHGGSRVPGEKLGIVLLDHATGISMNEELRMKDGECATAIFDISGRQIANGSPRLQSRLGAKASEKSPSRKLPKGIYIVNGKKKVVE